MGNVLLMEISEGMECLVHNPSRIRFWILTPIMIVTSSSSYHRQSFIAWSVPLDSISTPSPSLSYRSNTRSKSSLQSGTSSYFAQFQMDAKMTPNAYQCKVVILLVFIALVQIDYIWMFNDLIMFDDGLTTSTNTFKMATSRRRKPCWLSSNPDLATLFRATHSPSSNL